MKVAAYQAPLLAAGSMAALQLIQQRVKWCEEQGIEILCCPEAILGGLADYATRPNEFAICRPELDLSIGSSEIVDPEGRIVVAARELKEHLIAADIAVASPLSSQVEPENF